MFATDEWFASASNLLKPSPPEWREGVFTDFGKWMDGWESRRKRIPGHDWCIIKLGISGTVHGFDVDTSYFTGNYAPRISIQGTNMTSRAATTSTAADSLHTDMLEKWPGEMGSHADEEEFEAVASLNSEAWETLVPMTPLQPGYADTCHNFMPVVARNPVTHLRLNLFPDGGVARLRVYGSVKPDFSRLGPTDRIDLVSLTNGALPIGWSDTHFGHPVNIVQPSRGLNMGDGWETARRLDRPAILEADALGHLKVPGSEWSVIQLGILGCIELVEVDTMYFRGNSPESFLLEGCVGKISPRPVRNLDANACDELGAWHTVVPRTKVCLPKGFVFVNHLSIAPNHM